jgi:energy-coupling factor transporter ATP-binding protein EcfA2
MELANFYKYLPKDKSSDKVKGYKNHFIEKNSRILMIGSSGTGKSNALINFIEKSSGEFFKIIICSFSTTDEPLYQYLQEKIPSVELINNIDDVPEVQQFDDKDKNKPKLIIFDDFITLTKKEMGKIFNYAISSRKFGFTAIFMCQSYTAVPKIISRNCNYIFLFRVNDRYSIKRIISNHGLSSTVSPETIEQMYYYAIKEPLEFFLIDLKTSDEKLRFRKNFTDFLTN